MDKKPRVLFLSTGNSTRSKMAEGIFQILAGDEFESASAGIETGDADPLAVEVMNDIGVDISHLPPKGVRETLKEHFGYVITIGDLTRERAPIYPFTPHLVQWDVRDPASAPGSDRERKEAFRRVRDEIGADVQELLRETLKEHRELPMWSRAKAG
jgi:arsenate reductase